MEEPLDLSALEPRQRPVVGPDKIKYMLITASVDATLKYRSAAAKAGVWDSAVDPATGKERIRVTGFNDVAAQELVLVAGTLAETEGGLGERVLLGRDGNPVLVPEVRIRRWHGDAIARLYRAALDLSPWLRRGDDDADPKESSGGSEGSSRPPTPPGT